MQYSDHAESLQALSIQASLVLAGPAQLQPSALLSTLTRLEEQVGSMEKLLTSTTRAKVVLIALTDRLNLTQRANEGSTCLSMSEGFKF